MQSLKDLTYTVLEKKTCESFCYIRNDVNYLPCIILSKSTTTKMLAFGFEHPVNHTGSPQVIHAHQHN